MKKFQNVYSQEINFRLNLLYYAKALCTTLAHTSMAPTVRDQSQQLFDWVYGQWAGQCTPIGSTSSVIFKYTVFLKGNHLFITYFRSSTNFDIESAPAHYSAQPHWMH